MAKIDAKTSKFVQKRQKGPKTRKIALEMKRPMKPIQNKPKIIRETLSSAQSHQKDKKIAKTIQK